MTGVCDPALPNGYSFDYINAEVLLKHAKVRDGRLVLDGGMEYRVLVLPKLRTMRPELLDAIERMVRAGLTVLGPAPDRSPGLAGYPGADERVKEIAERMWHSGAAAKYAVYGKGRVFNDGCSLEEVFASLSMRPDCRIEGQNTDVRFIHRTTEQGDIYFLSNQQERKVAFEAAFRTEDGAPELWDALTGVVRRLPGFSRQDGVTTVPLELDPYGSAFIVFDRTKEARQSSAENFPEATVLARVEGPWKVTFEGLEAPEAPVVLDTLCDWTVSDDPRIRYFSGAARYETAFEVENTGSKTGLRRSGQGDGHGPGLPERSLCRGNVDASLPGRCLRPDPGGPERSGSRGCEQLDEPVDRRSAAAARTTQDLDARQPVDRIFGVAVFRTARPCGCREIRL